jgi:RHS repeat-associated protein
VAGGASWTYSPTQKHAVTQAGSSTFAYAYDANGNMASRQGQTIQWSSYNYPIAISAGSGQTAEAVSFSYGPDRNRWQQIYTGNGTTETTNYIGGLMDVVVSGASVDYRHYIYAGSEPVAVYSRKGSGVNAFSYFLTDHQSSVAKIVAGSTGAVAASESFTPYGNRRDPSTWSGSPTTGDLTTTAGFTRQGYTFQTQLGLWMGLNHMKGRVQDAVTGRFLSADPSVPDTTNPQDYNRYTYARNNPLTFLDPSGFTTTTYQFREDWLWGYASFGQQSTCAGNCGGDISVSTAGVSAGGVGFGAGDGGDGDLDWSSADTANQDVAADTTPADDSPDNNPVTGSPDLVDTPVQPPEVVVVCGGSSCPGHSTVPLVPATFPNGQGIVDMRTGGPLLIPQPVSLERSVRLGAYIRGVAPGLRGLVMARIFAPRGMLDYQRTYSDNGNVVPDLIDAGYYQFGVIAAAAGYSLPDTFDGAGIANMFGNGDKTGPSGTNAYFISNTAAGWYDYNMGMYKAVGP